jgi:outer membrane lipoprotein carrier protein
MRRLIPALILIACTASAASDSLWANLRARYLGLKTLTGTFEEQICSDQAGTCQNFSGKFSIGVPDRYRLDVTEPQKQVIVSDGSSLWLYFPDQKRAPTRRRPHAGARVPRPGTGHDRARPGRPRLVRRMVGRDLDRRLDGRLS